MYKKICSGLLSLTLALGVSTKKSDASLIGGAFKLVGETTFWITAAVCNVLPICGWISAKEEEKAVDVWALLATLLGTNLIAGSGFYILAGISYGIGCLCDLGDNKKYDDAEEKRRQAEEKRKQEEHEMQMALLKKKLEEK